MSWEWLDERPIIVAIAGPNGAGKSTFFSAYLARSGLRFVNADVIARHTSVDAYTAARIADNLRRELVRQTESFVFETVFSDPVGEKIQFLKEARAMGYQVVVLYIGLNDANLSDERVAMRVAQGGHDVPPQKIIDRFPRTLSNLRLAIGELPHTMVYDNSDLADPFRRIARFDHGAMIEWLPPIPKWFMRVME